MQLLLFDNAGDYFHLSFEFDFIVELNSVLKYRSFDIDLLYQNQVQ